MGLYVSSDEPLLLSGGHIVAGSPRRGFVTPRGPRGTAIYILELVIVGVVYFALANAGGAAGYALAQIAFGFLLALVMGAAPAMLVELFPSEYRMSGYSVSFNTGIGIAGGTAPVVATSLIGATGDLLAPAWFLMFGAALAAGAAFVMKDRSRDPLR